MSKYRINYKQLVNNLVPYFLRGSLLLNLLYTVTKVLRDLNLEFFNFTVETSRFLLYDSRKIYLEKILNDLYDSSDRLITITNTSVDPEVYLFNISEAEEETYLFNIAELEEETYIFNIAETLGTVNFQVNVPTAVSTSDTVIEALVNRYITSGKEFEIVRF